MPDVYLQATYNRSPMIYLGDFYPYKRHKLLGGTSSNYDTYSKKILDFKENRQLVVQSFATRIDAMLGKDFSICVVPSHEAFKHTGPLYDLVHLLCQRNNRINASGCLVRNKTISKLAHGGNRNLDIHLNSIIPMNTGLITGHRVLLLDDVYTSGNSIEACRLILQRVGANGVWSLVLAKTV